MSDVMMALGDFQFTVSTLQYSSLKTAYAWRWAKKDRVNRKPAKQFQGADATAKTFEIVLFPNNQDDLGRFQSLKELADAGEPLRLIAGGSVWSDGVVLPSGADLGLWVVDALDVNETMFMTDGTALEQKGALTISEYGEDSYAVQN